MSGGRRDDGPRDLLPDLFALAGAPPLPDERRAPARRREAPVPATGETAEGALTVTTLVRTMKDVLEGAFFPLWIKGEVCDFKRHRSGHWYFGLRDQASQLRCVVWSRDQLRIPAPPDEGMQVCAYGRVRVYEARSEVQFVVTRIEAVGDGLWRKALDASVKRLTAEGLLAPERKRPLPRYPRRIAVVTSPDGAALRDIIAVVRRRNPLVELVVCGAKVQGDGAPEDLVRAIRQVGRWGACDLVIVGRGGGSREDLWAFNDERVARALADCPVPTISAVGHEIDMSLTDLVADLRAPTPSAAAEAAVPVLADMRAALDVMQASLRRALSRRATLERRDLQNLGRRLTVASRRAVERRRARWERTAGRLDALSPLAVLGRGYGVARAEDGRALPDASAFAPGMPFRLVLRDGTVRATTESVEPGQPPRARRPTPDDA